ncbi:hypothetical protein ACTXT7_012419 [Hymenolepis weldensis]
MTQSPSVMAKHVLTCGLAQVTRINRLCISTHICTRGHTVASYLLVRFPLFFSLLPPACTLESSSLSRPQPGNPQFYHRSQLICMRCSTENRIHRCVPNLKLENHNNRNFHIIMEANADFELFSRVLTSHLDFQTILT